MIGIGLFECGKVDFWLSFFERVRRIFPPYVDFPQFEVKKVVEKRVETCVEIEEKAYDKKPYAFLFIHIIEHPPI